MLVQIEPPEERSEMKETKYSIIKVTKLAILCLNFVFKHDWGRNDTFKSYVFTEIPKMKQHKHPIFEVTLNLFARKSITSGSKRICEY
jgi:hypothetical protein